MSRLPLGGLLDRRLDWLGIVVRHDPLAEPSCRDPNCERRDEEPRRVDGRKVRIARRGECRHDEDQRSESDEEGGRTATATTPFASRAIEPTRRNADDDRADHNNPEEDHRQGPDDVLQIA